jgi:hypothetical protein
VVGRLTAHIARSQPGVRSFTRPNLFRMRQFYEAYADAGAQTSALLRCCVAGRATSSSC